MEHKIVSLLNTLKNVDAFGLKYSSDFLLTGPGGVQFLEVHDAVTATSGLGATQVSGLESAHSAVLGKVAGRFHLHDDMIRIVNSAHALALTSAPDIAGKFLIPQNHGDQALLNSARAFAADALPYQTLFVSTGLDAGFLLQLNADITALEALVTGKGAGVTAHSGATGALEVTVSKAAVALHVLKTVVPNVYKNNPQRLAEWAAASHVEKHTPVKREKPTTPPTP